MNWQERREEKRSMQVAYDSSRAIESASPSFRFVGTTKFDRLGASKVKIFPKALWLEQLEEDTNVLPFITLIWSSINATLVSGLPVSNNTSWNEFSFIYEWDRAVPSGEQTTTRSNFYKPIDKFFGAISDMSAFNESRIKIADKNPLAPGELFFPGTNTLVSFVATFVVEMWEPKKATYTDEDAMK
jgi:hypothetical protein